MDGASSFDGQVYTVTGTLAMEQMAVAQFENDGTVSPLAETIVVHKAEVYLHHGPNALHSAVPRPLPLFWFLAFVFAFCPENAGGVMRRRNIPSTVERKEMKIVGSCLK